MSFLLNLGQAFFSGLSSIATGVTSDVTSVANGINYAFNVLAKFLQKLPSEIATFFQSIPGALVAFAHAFGTYLWDGMQRIASGFTTIMAPIERGLETLGTTVINALTVVWNDIKAFASAIYNSIVSMINNIVTFVQPFINDLKNAISFAYNFLLNVINDVYSAFTIISNFFLDLPTFFQNASNYLNSLFTDPGNQPNLLTMVPNLVASEVSRIAGAFPDVIAYNTFMEVLPKMVSGIASSPIFGNTVKGMFAKALLMAGSPILSALLSELTKALMQSLFTSTQTTQTTQRPSQPQIQPPSAPSTQLQQRSTQQTSLSDLQNLQTQQLTPTQIEVQLERPNVTGVFTQDVIGMGTASGGTAKLVSGYINFQNSIKQFEDVFDITASFFMELIQSLQTEFSQDMAVNVSLTLLENIYQVSQAIEIIPSVDATTIVLPPGISLCNPSQAPSPSESTSTSTNSIDVTTTVDVTEQLCIPPYDLLADGLTTQFAVIALLHSNISDVMLAITQLIYGITFSNLISDILSASTQLVYSITSNISTSDTVSVSASLTPSPPPSESYTYYVPIDVAVTYTIQIASSTTYSGTLSYTVSTS
ncbi:SIFV.gp56-like protein [Sulfolobus islandicus filamentous virus 2]|uniref:SIFV.gp56-like protein n=1 Tax=Sulfolobus islandicus filamentous virus 2 TaxID=1902331 RepID=A0A1D8BJA6_SIFV|nr:SIFV.gp56-like protein [Sulfolobus islandicus filamentous virus 2]